MHELHFHGGCHHHYHSETSDQVMPALGRIEKSLAVISTKEDTLMKTADELLADVQAEETVGDSMAVLLTELKTRLDAAGTDPSKLQAISDDLAAHQTAWASAVAANTPAETAAA